MEKSNTLKFVMAGKLGDFILSLMAVRGLCEEQNKKADISIIDLGWDYGIKNTYKELKPLIEYQPYVNSLNILKSGYSIKDHRYFLDYPPEFDYDLGLYITSPLLYHKPWFEIYSDLFKFKVTGKYGWLQGHSIDDVFYNKIVINRKANTMRNSNFPYDAIIKFYGKNNIIFVSSNKHDYQEFPWKDEIEFYQVKDLADWFAILNSAFMFIGNCSAPAAIRSAFNKPRIYELPNTVDAYHWMGEERHCELPQACWWYLNQSLTNLKFL